MSSAVALNRELTLATGIRIFTQNLRNRLNNAGLQLRARKPAVRRPLSVEPCNRRLQVCQDHVNCHHHHIQGVLSTVMNQDLDLISMIVLGVYGERKNEQFNDC